MTSFTWKECAQLPITFKDGNAMVINGKVYCGGRTNTKIGDHTVFCFDPSHDNWTSLPPLPVKWFGLGQLNGQLIAVGGRDADGPTNEVYEYNMQSNKWAKTICPMPTAKQFPGVLSLHSALVVVGGNIDDPSAESLLRRIAMSINLTGRSVVEIFKPDTSEWYTTDPLPRPSYSYYYSISLTLLGNTCYALVDIPLHATIDDLLRNAVPANQTPHIYSSDTHKSAWKKLPDTPNNSCVAAVLAGNLIALGGRYFRGIFMYKPSFKSWVYIGDLPAGSDTVIAANLSPLKVVLITLNKVYEGTPNFFE